MSHVCRVSLYFTVYVRTQGPANVVEVNIQRELILLDAVLKI